MILEMLSDSFEVIGSWRFWLVLLCYGSLVMSPALIFDRTEKQGEKPFPQTVSSRFLWILWASTLAAISLIVLAPSLLQGAQSFGWDLFLKFGVGFYVALGIVVLILSLFETFVRVVRQVTIGGTLRAYSVLALIAYILSGGQAQLWPSLIPLCGLAVAGALLAYLIGGLVTVGLALMVPLRRRSWGEIALIPLASFPVMMPAVVYSAWIRVANGM